MSARLKFNLIAKSFAVSIWLFSGLISSNVHVSALDMNPVQETPNGCVNACNPSQSGIKQEMVLVQSDKDVPVPPPKIPYYVKFQTAGFTAPRTPVDIITNSSFKPPDLSILNSSFKF